MVQDVFSKLAVTPLVVYEIKYDTISSKRC